MTALSQLLNEHMPDGWTGDTIVQEAEKHHEKINRATAFDYLAGRHGRRPSEHVLRAFAAALPVTIAELRTAARLPVGENAPWTPPPEADRLNDRQRQAVEELIKAIVAPNAGSVSGGVTWSGAVGGQAPDLEEPVVHLIEEPDPSATSERPASGGRQGSRRKAK